MLWLPCWWRAILSRRLSWSVCAWRRCWSRSGPRGSAGRPPRPGPAPAPGSPPSLQHENMRCNLDVTTPINCAASNFVIPLLNWAADRKSIYWLMRSCGARLLVWDWAQSSWHHVIVYCHNHRSHDRAQLSHPGSVINQPTVASSWAHCEFG